MLLNQHEKLAALKRTEEKTMTQAEEKRKEEGRRNEEIGKG
jgi:hypothetical protein